MFFLYKHKNDLSLLRNEAIAYKQSEYAKFAIASFLAMNKIAFITRLK
jgi:hypothetical protein